MCSEKIFSGFGGSGFTFATNAKGQVDVLYESLFSGRIKSALIILSGPLLKYTGAIVVLGIGLVIVIRMSVILRNPVSHSETFDNIVASFPSKKNPSSFFYFSQIQPKRPLRYEMLISFPMLRLPLGILSR